MYYLVRPLARIGIWFFYRKINLSNTERIPVGKPVILAVNHPTGFMEPCILACYLDRPLFFLVRGDFFKKAIYNFLMRSLHMIPIYRAQDLGFRSLKKNYSTFQFCYDALREKKTMMILAEGSARFEKNLRPLKKGTARIAFGALEAYPELEDVYVVPVGVNYTYAESARSEVMIDFAEPIKVRDYLDTFQENASQGTVELNEELRRRLEERIVIVEKGDEELAEYLLRLDRSERPRSKFSVVGKSEADLQAEKRVGETVRSMPTSQKSDLLERARPYFQQLQSLGIQDVDLVHLTFSAFGSIFLLILVFPLFLVGFLFNFLPIRLAKIIPDTKVKRKEFLAPVFWAVSLGTMLIWWIIWIVIFLNIGKPLWILWLIPLTILGYVALLYAEYFQQTLRKFRVRRLKPEKRASLLAERAQLLDMAGLATDKNHSQA